MGVGGQHHALAALPPGKTQYPLYRRLGRPLGWSGWVRKIPAHGLVEGLAEIVRLCKESMVPERFRNTDINLLIL